MEWKGEAERDCVREGNKMRGGGRGSNLTWSGKLGN